MVRGPKYTYYYSFVNNAFKPKSKLDILFGPEKLYPRGVLL